MSKSKTVVRRLRQRRRGIDVKQLEDLYYFLDDLREDIEAKKKEQEDKEKGNKPPENALSKKYSFGQILFWQLITGPIFGLFWLKIFWPYFH